MDRPAIANLNLFIKGDLGESWAMFCLKNVFAMRDKELEVVHVLHKFTVDIRQHSLHPTFTLNTLYVSNGNANTCLFVLYVTVAC